MKNPSRPSMPGGTSTQIFSYESNWNNGQIAPRSAKTVDGYLWGYNDGPNGISLTQFIQDTTNGIAWSHAQGHLAFICTLTSAARETNTYGGNCTRSNMNVAIYGLLTNLPPTCPDALVTLDRDPNMGPYGSYSNQTYFVNTSLDGNSQIHPTGLGYQLMCDRWIIPAINYLNGQQGGGYASYQGGTNYVFCHITNGVPSWNNNP